MGRAMKINSRWWKEKTTRADQDNCARIWVRAVQDPESWGSRLTFERSYEFDESSEDFEAEIDGCGDEAEIWGLMHGDGVVQFLLENGLCPMQWFQLEIRYSYHQSYDGEWDCAIHTEIIDRQPERHLLQWEAWIGREYSLL